MAPSASAGHRLKVNLKLTINRAKIQRARVLAIQQQQRRAIADLLAQGKEASAKLRTEQLLNDDVHQEALELVEMYAELLLARFPMIADAARMEELDGALREAVVSLAWAGPRAGVKELTVVRHLLLDKYGRSGLLDALSSGGDDAARRTRFGAAGRRTDASVPEAVSQRLAQKLVATTPEAYLVHAYLKEIARAYNIPWHPANVPGAGGAPPPTERELAVPKIRITAHTGGDEDLAEKVKLLEAEAAELRARLPAAETASGSDEDESSAKEAENTVLRMPSPVRFSPLPPAPSHAPHRKTVMGEPDEHGNIVAAEVPEEVFPSRSKESRLLADASKAPDHSPSMADLARRLAALKER